MENGKKLKNARNILLKLHKSLLDRERELYEGIHGPLKPTQFLTLLLEDEDFEWLRKFSMLIDEMFAQKDGIEPGMIDANLVKVTELVEMAEPDEFFRAKYQLAIQRNPDSAGLHSELKAILSDDNGRN